ncbi:MAG: hypothetical protein NTW04_05970 [Elusimicrobia bacterium]|nr:hypothetical protein [Elusimicrobiota bacterium]
MGSKIFYVIGFSAAASFAAVKFPKFTGLLFYEFFMAAGISAVLFTRFVKSEEGKAETGGCYFWFWLAPSLMQMWISVKFPDFYWVSPACFILAGAYYYLHKNRPKPDGGKMRLSIFRPYLIICIMALPVCLWDWRQIFSVIGLWSFAWREFYFSKVWPL